LEFKSFQKNSEFVKRQPSFLNLVLNKPKTEAGEFFAKEGSALRFFERWSNLV
jgi:hypothetical protein